MAVVLGPPPTCPRLEATCAVHAVQARPQQAAPPQCISMYARCCHGPGLPGVQSGESAPELVRQHARPSQAPVLAPDVYMFKDRFMGETGGQA